MRSLLVASLATVAHGAVLPTREQLVVRSLPSLQVPFPSTPMFAGLMPVGTQGNQLYFYFIQSPNDSPTTPLTFWFTGGPGCSSMSAFLMENGPFNPLPKGVALGNNSASWTTLMNMVWVDSPAPVGFSVAGGGDPPSDASTARDAYDLVQNFLTVFDSLRSRPLYITGESFAGHYVPNLVSLIIERNGMNSRRYPRLNIAGFLVGNPSTDATIDTLGTIETFGNFGLITEQDMLSGLAACNFTYPQGPPAFAGATSSDAGPTIAEASDPQYFFKLVEAIGEGKGPDLVAARKRFAHSAAALRGDPDSCNDVMNNWGALIQAVNVYDVYEDICVGEPTIPPLAAKASWAMHPGQALRQALFGKRDENGNLLPIGKAVGDSKGPFEPIQAPRAPCVAFAVSDYLNRRDVQSAINAPIGTWHTCEDVSYDPQSMVTSIIPKYKYILNYMKQDPKFKFLVYSGDVDSVVPYLGTRAWVNALKLTPYTDRMSWSTDSQTAGWVESFAGGRFVFATVRGAGHMVPTTRPVRMYEAVRRFLDGTLALGGPWPSTA